LIVIHPPPSQFVWICRLKQSSRVLNYLLVTNIVEEHNFRWFNDGKFIQHHLLVRQSRRSRLRGLWPETSEAGCREIHSMCNAKFKSTYNDVGQASSFEKFCFQTQAHKCLTLSVRLVVHFMEYIA